MNRVNVNTVEPEVEKEIIRIKEKRAADKAKKEQKEAEKEAKRAAKEIAKQREAAGKNGYNSERTALRERINSIMREDNANNASAYQPAQPVQEQNVTVVLPRDEMPVFEEETVVTEQPVANNSEEAALGNYLNR